MTTSGVFAMCNSTSKSKIFKLKISVCIKVTSISIAKGILRLTDVCRCVDFHLDSSSSLVKKGMSRKEYNIC